MPHETCRSRSRPLCTFSAVRHSRNPPSSRYTGRAEPHRPRFQQPNWAIRSAISDPSRQRVPRNNGHPLDFAVKEIRAAASLCCVLGKEHDRLVRTMGGDHVEPRSDAPPPHHQPAVEQIAGQLRRGERVDNVVAARAQHFANERIEARYIDGDKTQVPVTVEELAIRRGPNPQIGHLAEHHIDDQQLGGPDQSSPALVQSGLLADCRGLHECDDVQLPFARADDVRRNGDLQTIVVDRQAGPGAAVEMGVVRDVRDGCAAGDLVALAGGRLSVYEDVGGALRDERTGCACRTSRC